MTKFEELRVTLNPYNPGFEEAFLNKNFYYDYGSLGEPVEEGWELYELNPLKQPDLRILTYLWGCEAYTNCGSEICYYNKDMDCYVANGWNGDGCTIIYTPKYTMCNDDSKYADNWRFKLTETGDWTTGLDEDYYE